MGRIPICFLWLLFVIAAILPIQAEEANWQLKAGFNFRSHQFVTATTVTAAGLLEENPLLDTIFRFDETTQNFVFRLRLSDGQFFGEDFPLPLSEGVIIKAREDTSISYTGTIPESRNLQLSNTGFHLVGTAGLPPSLNSESLLLERADIASVFQFLETTQQFEFQLRLDNGQLFGEGFPLQPGYAYFLKSTEDFAGWGQEAARVQLTSADSVSAALFKDGIQVTSTINGTVIELTTASLTEPTFFEVRVWQSLSDDSGFYPQSEVVTLVPGQVRTSSISLQPVPTITYTDQTMTFAASPENATTIFNGKPLRVGDVITAFDSSGVLCGVHLVKNAGLYAVVVTGDDPETVQDEGASAGEMISFKINNQSATVLSGNPIWNGGGGFPLIVELSASE